MNIYVQFMIWESSCVKVPGGLHCSLSINKYLLKGRTMVTVRASIICGDKEMGQL